MAAHSKKSIRSSVLLPRDTHARISALAATNNISAAWVIRHAALKFLEEHGDQAELPWRLTVRNRKAEPR